MLNPALARTFEPAARTLSKRGQRSEAATLAGLCLSVLMPSLDTGIANAGLATLAESLNASFQDVQWIVLAYLLSLTSLIVGAGRLGDAFGRKRLLLSGIVVFTFSSVLCALASTVGPLLAARLLQGLGAALMAALAVALVSDAVPAGRTGRALGLLGTMSALGTALGPSLGGLLMARFGWRSVFLVNVPLGVIALIMAQRHLPSDRSGSGASGFDLPGTLLLAFSLGAYALAVTRADGQKGAITVGLLLAAAGGLWLLALVESKAPVPLVRVEMLRDAVLFPGLMASLLVSTVMMTTLVVGPFYLVRALGLGTVAAGFVLSLGPLVAALTGVFAGGVVDRFGPARITTVGLVAIATGATIQSLLPTRLGVSGYLPPIVVMTAGYALFQTANNTGVMNAAPGDQRGGVAGALGLARNLGLITGTAVMGGVFGFASSSGQVAAAGPEAIAAAMRFTFAIAAGLVALALAISTRRALPVARG